MIENRLSLAELKRLLQPFLRQEPISAIPAALQDVLGFRIQRFDDITYQSKLLFSFDGNRIDFRDIRETAPGAVSVVIQFRAGRKWWHGVFRDQNAGIVRALQRICRTEIDRLNFTRYQTTVAAKPFIDDGPPRLIFLHDSRAFNHDWKATYDISPLPISPDCHDGQCYVTFVFNSAAYQHSGDTTSLKPDWLASACLVSLGIEWSAISRLGLG